MIFSLYHSSSHLKIPRTFPVSSLNKTSHRNAKGTNWCRIECSIQPCGRNEASLTTKKKKMKKKIFLEFISTIVLQFPQTLPVLWLNQASHRNAKGTIECRIECSIQPWGQNEDSLTIKKKKNEKKDFFSIYQYHSCYSSHKHCLFSGWTKRLTEMPSAPLNAELNALINHGIRMRPAWLQKKKKKRKKRFF